MTSPRRQSTTTTSTPGPRPVSTARMPNANASDLSYAGPVAPTPSSPPTAPPTEAPRLVATGPRPQSTVRQTDAEFRPTSGTAPGHVSLSSTEALGQDGAMPAVFHMKMKCEAPGCKQVFVWAKLRHHCRNCGKSVCKAHSEHVALCPAYPHESPKRVCDECYTALTGNSPSGPSSAV